MQKKVIALAVAALASGAAFAQSNVTVYGVMDAFVGVNKADNATGNQSQYVVNAGGLSSSRLGFKGEEDLGNGLKGVFTLELGSLSNDAATNGIGNTRQSYVGLESNQFGKLHLGRIQGYAWWWAVKYDPQGMSNALSVAGAMNGSMLFSSGNTYGRLQNAVSYISPTFSGLTVRGDFAAGEQVTGTSGSAATAYNKAQKYYALGADYANGPLAGGLGYATIQDQGGTNNGINEKKMTEWAAAVNYDFKVVKPFATYQKGKITPAAGAEVNQRLFNIGLTAPVGAAGTVRFSYADFKNDVTNANVKAKGYSIAYLHAMSKRTTLYGGFMQFNNGQFASFTSSNTGAATTSLDKNAHFYGVGILHTF